MDESKKEQKRYDHGAIESKWQKVWQESGIYNTPDKVSGKENFYLLVEFPYPSGNLHIGHWYAFAVPDIFARYKRMNNFNVMFPIGFDSFGLPAENAAIKRGLDPRQWTRDNIEYMITQLKSMGNALDWSRKVVTCEPEYYKWMQWLFLKLYKKGLIYKGSAPVNWCDSCKTVLANEQVINDECERCGSKVIQKELEQWFVKITDYAERLINDLDKLDWPEEIKQSQKNWIGKSEGAHLEFPIADTKETIKVFTTRPDTLFGVTYIVLAPEHPLISKIQNKIKNWDDVSAYIQKTKNKTELERTVEAKIKTGVEIEGLMAINPANKERVPIYVADYVIGSYGTGAVMAVPAHDTRDFEFAKEFSLPIKFVIKPASSALNENEAYIGEGIMIKSDKFNGIPNKEAFKKITKFVKGKFTTTYKLRDWLISRQRYWGAPIPVVYDPKGKAHPIPEKLLPWLLPQDIDFKPTGQSPLATSKELFSRTEDLFGNGWKPELDTMDTFMDSSWYYLRYTDPKNKKEFSSKKKMNEWMPVDLYSGGAEHTTVHLLYSRFFQKALFDLKLVKDKEPYVRRMNRGLILGPDGNKMSKSKGNVIDPDEQVRNVGADSVKMYLAFLGPYNETGNYPWNLGGIAGVRRFIERVYSLAFINFSNEKPSKELLALYHQTLKKVGEDIEQMKFNTAISQMMIFLNTLESQEKINREIFENFLKMVAPFAPYLTEEIWMEIFKKETSIHLESWPKYDSKAIKDVFVKIAVQVNGKVRGAFEIVPNTPEKDVIKKAVDLPEVKKWFDGQKVKKTIYIKNRLVSIVI